AETPLETNLVKTAGTVDTMIFAHQPPVERLAALHNAGVGVFDAETLEEALSALHGFHVNHLFVEGGAQIAREFLRRDLVDRLVIFQSPSTLGPGARHPFEGTAAEFAARLDGLPVLTTNTFGEDTMTVYAIREV
ncbi:MAG TPA: dihydrofolate reductase family protein, partial [Gemmatimonadaceae bacterium]|nr:dihydrofolate reductase family protein [Gemmatimonadaceae bacterium]